MSYTTLLYSIDAGIATITLNRPKTLNALTTELLSELAEVLRLSADDAAVRCVILTGAGRGFSSGAQLGGDASTLATGKPLSHHLRTYYNPVVEQMTSMEKPIIGAINGVAAGAGCGIALATDMRIVSDRAYFMQAFTGIGLIPDSGSTWFLPRMVGYARAFEMMMTAEKVPAQTALEWGLVNYVVPHDQHMQICMAWAHKLANGPTIAYGITKRVLQQAMVADLATALELEAVNQDEAADSADATEGVIAFIQRRKPNFTGK